MARITKHSIQFESNRVFLPNLFDNAEVNRHPITKATPPNIVKILARLKFPPVTVKKMLPE